MDLGNSLGNNALYGGTEFDYVFTDKELQDVLDRQQSGSLVDPLLFLNPTALQFQPHLGAGPPAGSVPAPLDYDIKEPIFDVMDLGAMLPTLVLTPEQQQQQQQQQQQRQQASGQSAPYDAPHNSAGSSGSNGGMQACNGGVLGGGVLAPDRASLAGDSSQHGPPPAAGPLPTAAAQAAAAQQQPAPLRQSQQLQHAQHVAAHLRKDGKPHVSHSTVEKQRRDRINSLIDELRELVPPSRHDSSSHSPHHTHTHSNSHHHHGHQGAADPHDVKRPKHVVLSDTIAMVRELQERVLLSETQLARLREHEEHCPFHEHEHHQAALRAAERDNNATRETSSGSRDSHPELPHAPHGTHAPEEPAVCVEEGEEGCLYVKVSCRDRHGLLSDIVRGLRGIPVEIVTAAITTTRDGGVYDVFQVIPEDGARISHETIASCIQEVLESHHTGDKRRRDSM